MKLTMTQALATVLQIKTDDEGKTYFRSHNGIDIALGSNLHNALVQAVDLCADTSECNYAIFPIGSDRGDLYMAIEREVLRQESANNAPLYESIGTDPRQLITFLMETLRDCALNVVSPVLFQSHLLRVGCVLIAGLQWAQNWIQHLRMRNAATAALAQEERKIVPISEVPQETPPPLFGAEGLASLQKPSAEEIEIDRQQQDEQIPK